MFLVTVLVGWVSVVRHDSGAVVPLALIWLLFLCWTWIGTRYRVFWTDDAIIRRASGLPELTLYVRDICRVHIETGSAGRPFRRPFNRITICPRGGADEKSCIDVSLKHFVADDIRTLMRAIKAARPDLDLPSRWL